MTYGRPRPVRGRARDGVGDVLARERRLMLAVARRQSLCEADAEDAVQAASERYLRHHRTVDPETAQGWLLTVARNEAVRVRERRVRAGVGQELDERHADAGPGPEEVAGEEDRVALAREALAGLKPAERLALLLQAEGRTYGEIAETTDWSRTKVNRALTEGRAALRRGAASVAAGEACAALEAPRARLAAGEADADDLLLLRPHLRRCGACRAELRVARGGRLVLAPPLLLAWLPVAVLGRLDRGSRAAADLAQRAGSALPGSADAGSVAAAGGVTATIAAGVVGLGAVGGEDRRDDRPALPATPPASRVLAEARVAAPSPQPVARAIADRGATSVRAAAQAAASRAAAAERAADARARRASARRARSSSAAAAPSSTAASPAATSPAPAAAPSAPSSGAAGGSGGGGGGSADSEFGFE